MTLFLSTPLLDPEPLDINTAGARELAGLPGIGPARAASIVEYRTRFGSFMSVTDLLLVPGIGPGTLSGLGDLVTAGDPALPVDTLHWLETGALGDTLLTMVFLDVGNGDATLLLAAGGESWLIDGGPDAGGPIAAPVAARLVRLGVDSLEVVTLTHPHADHVGGLADVLRIFRVAMVMDPGMAFSSWVYEEFLLSVLDAGSSYAVLEEGSRFDMSSSVSVAVLRSEGGDAPDLDMNEASAVFLVTCGGFSALIAGDIGDDTEMELTGSIPPLTVLLVPHHGSRSSAFPPFARMLRPQVAVFSAGRGNPFGHPDPDVVDLYTSLGAEILRTDRDGTIVLHTDGRGVQYSSSMRGSPP